jgi:hypothetical protein
MLAHHDNERGSPNETVLARNLLGAASLEADAPARTRLYHPAVWSNRTSPSDDCMRKYMPLRVRLSPD